jgi:hypothetical protein
VAPAGVSPTDVLRLRGKTIVFFIENGKASMPEACANRTMAAAGFEVS